MSHRPSISSRHEAWQLTSTVMRVLDDRRTTRRSAIIKLTTIPISMFQRTERENVMNIIAKSFHAPILVLGPQVRRTCLNDDDIPVVVYNVMWNLEKEGHGEQTYTGGWGQIEPCDDVG